MATLERIPQLQGMIRERVQGTLVAAFAGEDSVLRVLRSLCWVQDPRAEWDSGLRSYFAMLETLGGEIGAER